MNNWKSTWNYTRTGREAERNLSRQEAQFPGGGKESLIGGPERRSAQFGRSEQMDIDITDSLPQQLILLNEG